MRQIILIALIGCSLGRPAIVQATPASIVQAETAIRDVYYTKVDRSIQLRGVTIVQDWALAHWQGKQDGGMVIFQQGKTGWKIVRGTGGSFTYQDLVSRFAIPPAVATQLIKQGVPELADTLPIQVESERK
jgi:hypothetical protein